MSDKDTRTGSEKREETLRRLREMKDEDIDYSDIPKFGDEFWDNARLVYPKGKRPISVRLDEDVLAFFKSQGKGYQTRINAVLRSYMEHAQGSGKKRA